jgi:hypothetical protein
VTGAKPKIDQLVFGYRDGHELLASSMPMSSATAREVLPHVDASFEDDSPHYLVGMPLSTIDRYLLARIWPAPEVARPGAVWAHAVLLDRAAMDHCPAALLRLFQRPSFPTLERFARAPRAGPPSQPLEVPKRLATGLAWAALGAPDDQPVVLWRVLEEAEQAILNLLHALPRFARWSFAFRTRGRARLGDVAYDIQIASRLVGRPPSSGSKVLDLRRQDHPEAPRWTELATNSSTGKDLRVFLGRFGDASVTARPAVRELIDLWTALAEPTPDVVRVTSILTGTFPKPDALSLLKLEMFGDAELYPGLWPVPETDRLEVVVQRPRVFDWEDLGIRARLPKLLLVNAAKAAELAADVLALKRTNNAAASVLEEFAKAMGPSKIESLAPFVDLLGFVLQREPQLLEDPATWSDASIEPALGVLAVSAGRLDGRRVIGALLQSGREDAWQAILRDALVPLADVMGAVLSQRNPRRRLTQVESADPNGLAAWLSDADLSTSEAVEVAKSLSDQALRGRPAARWLDAGVELHRSFDPQSSEASLALTVIALSEADAAADQLLRETFAPVHRGLVERRISPRAAARLDPVLPGSEKEGRARRLRLALVQRAEAGDWTEHEIAHALEGAGERGERVTELVPKKDPLRRLLEAAVNRAADMLR